MLIENDVYLFEVTRKNIIYKKKKLSSMVYAVVQKEGVSLVDSGFPSFSNGIIEELKRISEDKPLHQILLTHADVDHIGNAYELQQRTGCRVYISQQELPYIHSQKKRFGVKQEMYDDFEVKTPQLTIYPSSYVGDFIIISTPGHSDGHICILYRNILFTGDLCSFINGVFRGPNPLFTENMEKANESLAHLSRYMFSIICPAHGLPTERRDYL